MLGNITAAQELGTEIRSMLGNLTAAQELGTQISSMIGNMPPSVQFIKIRDKPKNYYILYTAVGSVTHATTLRSLVTEYCRHTSTYTVHIELGRSYSSNTRIERNGQSRGVVQISLGCKDKGNISRPRKFQRQ